MRVRIPPRRCLTFLVTIALIVGVARPAAAAVTLPPGSIPLPTSGSFLYLNSQPGDYIGQGVEQLYTSRDSVVWASLPQGGTYFTARFIQGEYAHSWSIAMDAPRGQPLAIGSYTGAVRAGFEPSSTPGLSVSGDGRGCNTLTGQFDVNELAYSSSGVLLVFDATFEQHCDGGAAALYGRLRIVDEVTPGVTLPAGSIAVPSAGTFLYVNNSRGFERLLTAANSTFDPWVMLEPGGDQFQAFIVQGDYVNWADVTIAAPPGAPLATGSYIRAVRAVSRTAGTPGLDVGVNGAGCNTISGKFDIDALSFAPTGELLLFQATFEQRCDNTIDVLYGRIQIENPPPSPNVVLPAGQVSVPTSGTFLYLNSQPGDYVGAGQESLYKGADVQFSGALDEIGDYFSSSAVLGNYDQYWFVDVASPAGVPLAVGSYRHVARAPFRPDGVPGLDVSGNGRGCNTVMGRFDLNAFELWSDGELKLLQTTFEQHCEGRTAALLGRLRYEGAPLALAVDVREDVMLVDKGTLAVVTGTVSCGQRVTVEVTGTLQQTDNKGHVVTGSFFTTVDCVAPSAKWSTSLTPASGAFSSGAGVISAQAHTCLRLCHTASVTRSAKLMYGRS
jgi:hypothetical protein